MKETNGRELKGEKGKTGVLSSERRTERRIKEYIEGKHWNKRNNTGRKRWDERTTEENETRKMKQNEPQKRKRNK